MALVTYSSGKLTLTGTGTDAKVADIKAITEYLNSGLMDPGVKLVQDMGLKLEEKRLENISAAITDPAVYVANRAKRLKQIEATIQDEYKEAIAKLLEQGLPTDDAQKTAYAKAKGKGDYELAMLNLEFPAQVLEQSISSAMNRSLMRIV